MSDSLIAILEFVTARNYLAIPLIGAMVFAFVYLTSDRLIAWLTRRSLGERELVLKLMDSMYMENDQRRVTILMLVSSFGMGILFFFLLWPNVILGLAIGTIVTVIGWSVPKIIMTSLYEKRCGRFVDQMVDAMVMLANGIKTGMSVQQSMARVVESMQNPISQEFQHVLDQINLGRSQQEALNELADRIPRQDVQMFVTAVNILNETGGNMAETFTTITETIRERQKVEKKIEALTSQGVMQGIIITLVPFGILAVFTVVDPNYVKPLFTTTVGVFALLAMLILQVLGGLMIRKIVTIKV